MILQLPSRRPLPPGRMKNFISNTALALLGLAGISLASNSRPQKLPVRFLGPSSVTANSLHNIHLEFAKDSSFEGDVNLLYGDCDLTHVDHADHQIGSVFVTRHGPRPERYVWATPSNIAHHGGQCLHAFSGTSLVGRSAPITVTSAVYGKRESIADVADALGPWFDGIAYMSSKNSSVTCVSCVKNSSVAIVGGGMSGLLTSLLLSSVGMHNWHIIEASQRVGGRIRTKYLNGTRPDQYQYQEMGPMRFPVNVTYSGTNETLEIQDHKMVFQLADVLNQMNDFDPELAVNFIEWIEDGGNLPTDSGGVRLPDGLVPTVADAKANSSLSYSAPPANPTAALKDETAYRDYTKIEEVETMRRVASNVFQAHKKAVEDGMFHWSEAGYLR